MGIYHLTAAFPIIKQFVRWVDEVGFFFLVYTQI